MEEKRLSQRAVTILFRDITALGGATVYGLVAVLVLLLEEKELFLKLVVGFLITFIITVLIRELYFKSRPKKQEYHNLAERIDASSFPSLHTARIVFFSLTWIGFFNYNYYLIAFFTLITITVAYSRIYLKKHDWWDLLGGVVLGGITFTIILIL
ncbi:phosphatase PAP2 family protein [Candidatus Woesearchaeota archaeon]|nr:phosphatase PAP2 family protein [Candidatus Woesearchaeota archaeon]